MGAARRQDSRSLDNPLPDVHPKESGEAFLMKARGNILSWSPRIKAAGRVAPPRAACRTQGVVAIHTIETAADTNLALYYIVVEEEGTRATSTGKSGRGLAGMRQQ